jgi:hypothetical protein
MARNLQAIGASDTLSLRIRNSFGGLLAGFLAFLLFLRSRLDGGDSSDAFYGVHGEEQTR